MLRMVYSHFIAFPDYTPVKGHRDQLSEKEQNGPVDPEVRDVLTGSGHSDTRWLLSQLVEDQQSCVRTSSGGVV